MSITDQVDFNDVKHITADEYFLGEAFAGDMFNAKYSHDVATEQGTRKETPAEVFLRMSSGLAAMEADSELALKYTKLWFSLLWNGWFRPGGSVIAGVGAPDRQSLLNCFSGDTRFITSKGVKSFASFKNGDKVDVLTNRGSYKTASVTHHGKQQLYEVVLRRQRYKKVLSCTKDHLWFINGTTQTKKTIDLKCSKNDIGGDKIAFKKRRWMLNTDDKRNCCPVGMIHGMVYGDGNYDIASKTCQLRLCNEKREFKSYFKGLPWNISDNDKDNFTDVRYLPNFMKELPDFDNINDEYVLGFFVGWFATDGTISNDGHAEISSANVQHLTIIASQLQRVGIYCSDIRVQRETSPYTGNANQKLYNLYIWRDSLFNGMFINPKHANNYNLWNSNRKRVSTGDWFVESVTDLHITEDVWCVNEPETNSFVLEHGILTHNCTTLPLEGDSIEAIAKCDYTIMKCAAFRQGLGVDASKLRPRGAKVNNAAQESTGVVPWVAKLVDNGKYVGQKGRMPALLISLKVHHPDIQEFVTAKTQKGVIENANISVQITDDFMQAVKDDADWELYFDFENSKYPRISQTIKAKDLFKLIADTAYKSAEPGVQYIDLLRKGSMVHQLFIDINDPRFEVISTNACSEKPLPPFSVCNLLSPNMEMFSTDPEKYKKEIEYIAPLIVRLSDNVVQYELHHKLSPLPEQAWILEATREIGIGMTNVHGWLLKQNLPYASTESCEVLDNFFKVYAGEVFKASVALGKEKGNAPAWNLFKDRSKLMNSVYFKNIVDTYYDSDYTKVTHMRNMAHMSIAPTGSLSNTFPIAVLGSGVEPMIGAYYWRKTRAINKGVYTHYFVIPNKVREYLIGKITDRDDLIKIEAFPGSVLDEDGAIGKELVEIINKYIPKDLFSPAHMIDPINKINMMSSIYKWMDASISVTYNLPSTAKEEDVYDIYMHAFDKGVRAVSVYVDGSREGILIFEDPITNAKKFKEAHENDPVCLNGARPQAIILNCAPKRPSEIPCDIYITYIKGVQWTVLVGLLNEQPFEVFCGQNEDLYLPQSCKTGIIRKQGGGKYELEVMIRRSPVVFKDLAGVLMTDNERALTRLLSLNLRHGVPPQYIVQQLKKTGGDITAFSTAISRVLSKYVGTHTLKDGENTCPTCGEQSLVVSEGCIKCVTPKCTFSRCGG